MCVLISRCCGSKNDHRDLLKFVQEVARFVTSRFLEKKLLGESENTKLLSWQHCAHLYYSPLSVCSSTRIFRRTHTRCTGISGPRPIRGGVHPSLSDWFRPRYEPNVCLLLNHRETFRVTDTFFFSSNGWLV